MQLTKSEQEMIGLHIKDRYYLEIGSGESTKWASSVCDRIDSVETRKVWFDVVKENTKDFSNVTLYHLPPEECAYDINGYETVVKQGRCRGDYGKNEEFKTYIESIKNLILENEYDVILIDGNVRNELVHVLRVIKFPGIFMVHDVSSRGFLDNGRIACDFFDIPELETIENSERLWVFRFNQSKNGIVLESK